MRDSEVCAGEMRRCEKKFSICSIYAQFGNNMAPDHVDMAKRVDTAPDHVGMALADVNMRLCAAA